MTSNWRDTYQRWRAFSSLEPELREKLEAIAADEQLLEDHFSKPIEFGTGGMRGELGPGINRINRYTVRKATAGLARYLTGQGESARQAGVVIAYDSRHQSPQLALETAKVLGWHGIRAYLFDRLFPTPLLSFAVRHLRAAAGVMITASHNPAAYNGYKVYGADGGQIPPQTAEELMNQIDKAGDELAIDAADEQRLLESGLLHRIGAGILDAYLEQVEHMRLHTSLPAPAVQDLRIVFTPLHGAAGEAIAKGLERFGYRQVSVVTEQAVPDPDFSTVPVPNPEEEQAFSLALRYAQEAGADLIMGTDPDGDRLGVLVKNAAGSYTMLSGNQLGALLLYDILAQKQARGVLPANGIVLKTIVTSELGRVIAADFGLVTEDTLTGFKYIGEKINQYEQTGQYRFLFGYEESFGFLAGDFVRDKDAVQTALLFADLCAYHKLRKESVPDVLFRLFARYGHYREKLLSFTCKGAAGMANMNRLMSDLRSKPFSALADQPVLIREDYLSGTRFHLPDASTTPLLLPVSDVLKYWLADGSWFCIRPSGTEPKGKLYLGTKGATAVEAEQKLARLQAALLEQIRFSDDEN